LSKAFALEAAVATSVLKSKLTKRSQTTIPLAVKNALHLGAGDQLGYVINGDEVRLVNVADETHHEDPLMTRFLEFLAQDAQARPQILTPLPSLLLARMQELSARVFIDHDADIVGPTAL